MLWSDWLEKANMPQEMIPKNHRVVNKDMSEERQSELKLSVKKDKFMFLMQLVLQMKFGCNCNSCKGRQEACYGFL